VAMNKRMSDSLPAIISKPREVFPTSKRVVGPRRADDLKRKAAA
jgi:hypothetical protein